MVKANRFEGQIVSLINVFLILFITCFFKILYSIPVRDSFLWFLGVFFYFFIPGNLLLRVLDFNKEEAFLRLFHSVALGTAFTPIFYMILRRLSLPEMVIPVTFAAFLLWLFHFYKDFKYGRFTIRTSSGDIIALFTLIAVILLLLHFSYFTDIIFYNTSFKLRNTLLTETTFHLGIINIMKDMFPPLFPYASGYDFSHYHLNMHLEIEMFHRLFSIDTLKLTYFYFPLLYFALLVFIPYSFVKRHLKSRWLGVLTCLLFFGSDLSYVPELLGISSGKPWIFSTTLWSLMTLNGYLPSLFIMFLFIYYIKEYYENGRVSYLILLPFLGYAAYGFKGSMGPHLIAIALLTGIVSIYLAQDRKKWIRFSAAMSLGAAAIILCLITYSAKSIDVIGFDLLNGFRRSSSMLGNSEVSWFSLTLMFPLYVLAVYGARSFGLYLIKDSCKKISFDPVLLFIILFSISGFLLAEVIYLGPPNREVNKAYFFAEQSLMCAWLLFPYLLSKLNQNWKKYVLTIVVIFIAFPASVQFFALRSTNIYHTVDSDAIEVTEYLQSTPVGSIVLHPPIHPDEIGPSLASNFAGRPSVINLFLSFTPDWIGEQENLNRTKDIVMFFNPYNSINRSAILDKYKVDYVYAPSAYADILSREPMLTMELKNSTYVIYKVHRGDKRVESHIRLFPYICLYLLHFRCSSSLC
jgi:hypothetical protein